jgi:hypothetical protein
MTIITSLLTIGAVQFGHFEQRGQPVSAAPLAVNLRLLPSYVPIMKALAAELAPLVRADGVTHLLTMPATTALGVCVSDLSGLTLVYPLDGQIEGAYDFSVRTVLLTDVLTDGAAELAMITQARRDGLEVAALVTILDLSRAGATWPVPVRRWAQLDAVLAASEQAGHLTPLLRSAITAWLAGTA